MLPTWSGCLALASAVALSCSTMLAQNEPAPSSAEVLHTGTSLVLVDVIAEALNGGLHSRELLTGLKAQDFRVFDNKQEVPIRSFDTAAEHTSRPVTLWLIMQCNMGLPPIEASGFLKGSTQLLLPSLSYLSAQDNVGVAHWCDNGEASIDLAPQKELQPAIDALDTLLAKPSVVGQRRQGELAMQKMIESLLTATEADKPARLPVFVFLYGDNSATYPEEADKILKDLLEHTGMVYGVDEETTHYEPGSRLRNGQIWQLGHYYSVETGGDYYSVERPELLSRALAYVIAQVHLRYVLGFKPTLRDGKRHKLRVELTDEAKRRYIQPSLRFRPEYIPTPLQ